VYWFNFNTCYAKTRDEILRGYAFVNLLRDRDRRSCLNRSPNNNSIEREVKTTSGRDARVGIYTSIRSDCRSGLLPSIRLAVAPEHGTVTVKRAILKATNRKQCVAVQVPALVAFYRANQNREPQTTAKLSRQRFEERGRRSGNLSGTMHKRPGLRARFGRLSYLPRSSAHLRAKCVEAVIKLDRLIRY